MAKLHFYVKLIPSRATFPVDMTSDERAIMQQHIAYTSGLFAEGKVLIFGPVLDATSPFGRAIFEAESEFEVRSLMEKDPSVSNKLNQFTVTPMKVGAAQGTSPR